MDCANIGRLLAVLLAAANLSSVALGDPPKAGARHPDFTLPRVADGKAVSLIDFRGRKVLLIQFASW